MSTQKVKEAAEAICGGLHRTDFAWLGDTENGVSSWFTRGDKPKIIRIEVVRSDLAPVVLVNIEWPSAAGAEFRIGHMTIQIDTTGPDSDVFLACEKAVLRCLEVFRDVIESSGVAGAQP